LAGWAELITAIYFDASQITGLEPAKLLLSENTHLPL
jgi:hypothetical protein